MSELGSFWYQKEHDKNRDKKRKYDFYQKISPDSNKEYTTTL